jgi:predicted RNA-binding protein with PUA domain
MGETEQAQKRKRKRKRQLMVLELEKVESELLPELVEALEKLEKEGKHVDIAVCPKCKSPRIRRVNTMCGDMFSHMGLTPPQYECRDCGWRGKHFLKTTNKPTTVRDVVIMAEAKDADLEKRRKEKKK